MKFMYAAMVGAVIAAALALFCAFFVFATISTEEYLHNLGASDLISFAAFPLFCAFALGTWLAYRIISELGSSP